LTHFEKLADGTDIYRQRVADTYFGPNMERPFVFTSQRSKAEEYSAGTIL